MEKSSGFKATVLDIGF